MAHINVVRLEHVKTQKGLTFVTVAMDISLSLNRTFSIVKVTVEI